MCLSFTGLKQEGREKQIVNVNPQKHKAAHWQLPRTAWHSWQFERSALNVFYSCKQKTDLSRCTRTQLPKQPTSYRLYSCKKKKTHKKQAADPLHEPYSFLIISIISCQCSHASVPWQLLLKVTFTSILQHNMLPDVVTYIFSYISYQPCSFPFSSMPFHSPKLLLHMFISRWQTVNKHLAAVFVSFQPPNLHNHHLHHFCHHGTPLQNHRRQRGNQRGGMVWAVSPPLLLMSCNLEQQEAMPAQGNCCCSVHSFTNRGGGSRS